MLILPKENNVIQGISIKLEDSIVREQIDYIQYEDIKLVDMLINIDDKAINIMFPMKVIYDTFDEHYLIIKDKAQENELIYIIKIVRNQEHLLELNKNKMSELIRIHLSKN